MITIEWNMDIRKKSWSLEIKNVTRGRKIKLTIADRPDILFNMNIKAQVNNITKPILKFKAKINPNDVATPLPPVKLLKTENIWPNSKNNEHMYVAFWFCSIKK